ncbi:hypothetical protein [Defluviitalea phaphyphila]|uniref:hypothetical protein n=1 Tax=Defluviitalea phaphyphila TaxID=1473580 RepID=UPI00072FFC53|nr:hypothetical protein [Defluviitalea phaphyphila]
MSCFLQLSDKSLLMVNYTKRNGLYYQTFKQSQIYRPSLLLSNGTDEYTACLDENDSFHIIAKNIKNQIVYFKESSNKISKDIILEDYNNEFKINNIYAISLNNKIHLFYYANHPATKNPQLIYNLLDKNFAIPKPLGNISSFNVNYDCIKYNDNLFLAMINKEKNNYVININLLNSNTFQWEKDSSPVFSSFPITHCKLCIDEKGIYHLSYIKEEYGQYQLIYKNKTNGKWSKEHLLYSCGHKIKPIIFIYYDSLWINWNENGTLKAILSIDNGNTFSSPIRTSMQDSNVDIHFYCLSKNINIPIICNQLYGLTHPTPKFSILHNLDIDGIHSDLLPNVELKLYINSIKDQLKLSVSKSELEEENSKLKNNIMELNEIQTEITNKYNELVSLTKKIQEEGKKWRTLYKEAKTEVEFYKKRAKQLEKSMETKKENLSSKK